MKSLENICKNVLNVSENISTNEIINFASKNNYNPHLLFLLNNFDWENRCKNIFHNYYIILGFITKFEKHNPHQKYVLCRFKNNYIGIYYPPEKINKKLESSLCHMKKKEIITNIIHGRGKKTLYYFENRFLIFEKGKKGLVFLPGFFTININLKN